MKIGAVMFFTTDSMQPAAAGARAGGARLRIAVGAGTHPHPVVPQDALSGGRRPDPALLRHHGSVPGAQHRGHGDDEAQDRHRHRPGDAARSDRHRQDRLVDRPALQRPLPVRRRQRLEPGRDREPRHRLREPPQAGARADRGDEDDLDRGRARVSRRVRELRQDEAVAQADAEAASADHRRRRLPLCRAARDPLRRRLDSPRRPAGEGRRRRGHRQVPRDGERSRPRSRHACRSASSACPTRSTACASARRSASTASSSPCRRRRRTSSCRSSTAGPS